MVKIIHSITITVFEKNPGDLEKIKPVFKKILSLDFQKEKIILSCEKVEGFNQKEIHIFTLNVTKNNHIKKLLTTVFGRLSDDDKRKLIDQRESRLDDEGYFYFRLDKKSLLNDKFMLTEKGDCFHFKIKLASFPASRSGFLQSLDMLFSTFCVQ